MTMFNPDSWAILAPNNDSGLGRMGDDMSVVMGIRRRILPSVAISDRKHLNTRSDVLMDTDASIENIKSYLEGLKGVITFEKFWHPQFLEVTRELGVKTVCVPMWEWFRGVSARWRNCDYFVCPNQISLELLRGYGFTNAVYAPWTLDLRRFKARRVTGPARHFVHNAGEIDPDDRKGTLDAIAAFHRVHIPDLSLTIRTQRVPVDTLQDPRIANVVGTVSEPGQLYEEGDAFIQPSKLEGIGFMVLEAVVTGIPVITVDNPPMNEWVRQSELLSRPSYFCYPSYSSSWVEHSHLRPVRGSDLVRCIEWAAQNDMERFSAENRIWAEETFDPERLRRIWEEILTDVLRSPRCEPILFAADPPPPCLRYVNRAREYVKRAAGVRVPFFRDPVAHIRSTS